MRAFLGEPGRGLRDSLMGEAPGEYCKKTVPKEDVAVFRI